MRLQDLSFLPRIKIDKNNLNYHERAEIFTRTNILDAMDNQYIMYVEGINYYEKKANDSPVLIGFFGIRNIQTLFGKRKTEKISVSIPIDHIRNYISLHNKK